VPIAVSKESEKRVKALAAFVRELKAVRKHFRWSVDEFGQIRGRHPEYYKSFCPLSAVAFMGTGQRFADVHEAAEVCGIADVSQELVDAIDNRNGSELRRGILIAVGVKGDF